MTPHIYLYMSASAWDNLSCVHFEQQAILQSSVESEKKKADHFGLFFHV